MTESTNRTPGPAAQPVPPPPPFAIGDVVLLTASGDLLEVTACRYDPTIREYRVSAKAARPEPGIKSVDGLPASAFQRAHSTDRLYYRLHALGLKPLGVSYHAAENVYEVVYHGPVTMDMGRKITAHFPARVWHDDTIWINRPPDWPHDSADVKPTRDYSTLILEEDGESSQAAQLKAAQARIDELEDQLLKAHLDLMAYTAPEPAAPEPAAPRKTVMEYDPVPGVGKAELNERVAAGWMVWGMQWTHPAAAEAAQLNVVFVREVADPPQPQPDARVTKTVAAMPGTHTIILPPVQPPYANGGHIGALTEPALEPAATPDLPEAALAMSVVEFAQAVIERRDLTPTVKSALLRAHNGATARSRVQAVRRASPPRPLRSLPTLGG